MSVFFFQYVKVARSLKYYGYLQFKSCMVDYPRENSRALFAAGEKEFNMRVQTEVVSKCSRISLLGCSHRFQTEIGEFSM